MEVEKKVSDLRKTVSGAIKSFRKQKKLGQAELSNAVDLSHRHIQKIEAAQIDLKLSTIESFAKTFQVPACYLLNEVVRKNCKSFSCDYELLDALHVGICVNDTQGKVLYANNRLKQMWGIEKEPPPPEIYVWSYLSDESEVSKAKAYLRKILGEVPEPSPYYAKSRSKDGTITPLKIDWDYMRGADGAIVAMASVITLHPSW